MNIQSFKFYKLYNTLNFFPHPLPKKFQFTYCTMFMYVLLVVKQKFPVKDYKNKNITP